MAELLLHILYKEPKNVIDKYKITYYNNYIGRKIKKITVSGKKTEKPEKS